LRVDLLGGSRISLKMREKLLIGIWWKFGKPSTLPCWARSASQTGANQIGMVATLKASDEYARCSGLIGQIGGLHRDVGCASGNFYAVRFKKIDDDRTLEGLS
jgi:hypothetical protein